jgi:hypothetical protein
MTGEFVTEGEQHGYQPSLFTVQVIVKFLWFKFFELRYL